MKLLLFCGIIYCAYKIISGLRQRSEKERDRKDKEEIKAELAVQKAQIQAEIERSKLETKRKIEAEKSRLAWQKRQDEINRKAEADRIRLEKEQQRQAAQLERHEDLLRKHEFQLCQAKMDIEFLIDREAKQCAMMDELIRQQQNCAPGTKEFNTIQNKIIALENQLHTTERKKNQAVFAAKEAERKLVPQE